MTRDQLTAGTVLVTVTLPETFVRARQLLGEGWHPVYTFRVERVERDSIEMLFVSCWDDKSRKFVYAGVAHQTKGSIRLTRQSAFPATATRFRVADRVLQCLFAGRSEKIAAAGWTVNVDVLAEVAGRF